MIGCSWPNFSCLLNEIESSRARKAKTAHIIKKQLINFAVFAVKAASFVTNRSLFRPKPGAHPENFEREDRSTCRLFVYYLFIDLSTLRVSVSRN